MSKRKGYNCPICDEIFTKEQLELHVDQHFSENIKEETRKCIFEGCNVTVNKAEWEDHLLAHEMCGKHELNQSTSEDTILAIAVQQQEVEENDKMLSEDALLAQSLQHQENKKCEEEEFKLLENMECLAMGVVTVNNSRKGCRRV